LLKQALVSLGSADLAKYIPLGTSALAGNEFPVPKTSLFSESKKARAVAF